MSIKVNGKLVAGRGGPGPQGPAGLGVPAGGAAGQVLAKKSDTDNDTEWITPSSSGGGTSGGSTTTAGVSSFNGRDGNVAPQKGDYTAEDVGALPDTTTIPSKTSELINNSNFITTSQMNTAIQSAILDSWEGSY